MNLRYILNYLIYDKGEVKKIYNKDESFIENYKNHRVKLEDSSFILGGFCLFFLYLGIMIDCVEIPRIIADMPMLLQLIILFLSPMLIIFYTLYTYYNNYNKIYLKNIKKRQDKIDKKMTKFFPNDSYKKELLLKVATNIKKEFELNNISQKDINPQKLFKQFKIQYKNLSIDRKDIKTKYTNY